jgi:hypothetical protein
MSATGSDGLWFWDRWLKSGYSDLGPITISPRPQLIILTDRADGTPWALWYEPGPPERLAILSDPATIAQISRQEGTRIYQQFDVGPLFTEDGRYLLIVRSGHLGFDFEPYPNMEQAASDAPIYARNGINSIQVNLITANPPLNTTTRIGLAS